MRRRGEVSEKWIGLNLKKHGLARYVDSDLICSLAVSSATPVQLIYLSEHEPMLLGEDA